MEERELIIMFDVKHLSLLNYFFNYLIFQQLIEIIHTFDMFIASKDVPEIFRL